MREKDRETKWDERELRREKIERVIIEERENEMRENEVWENWWESMEREKRWEK